MTLFLHELKRGKLALIIWSAAIAFMLGICVIIYPEMSKQMGELSEMFSDMGAFSDAFGMDQLNFGEFMGYFAIECGNTLGLGGSIFAAILGISALTKEEQNRTAEFLLSHPVSRVSILTSKALAILCQIFIMNLAVMSVTLLGTLAIGESAELGKLVLIFLANILMQIEIAAITLGVSVFIKSSGLGIGIGIAFWLYFLNIIANLSKDVECLKYITPFGYTDGGYIVENYSLEWKYLAVGGALTLIGIVLAYKKYPSKDV